MRGKDVEADGILFVGWVNQNHVLNAFRRNDAKNLIVQITVRVQKANPFAIFNVLADQIEEERGLAGAGCANYVSVPHPLVGRKQNGDGLTRIDMVAEQDAVGLSCSGWGCC